MIRVGIIGAGFMGRNHFNQYEKMTDRCQVVALCDREADRRAGDWSKVGGNVGDKQGTQRELKGITPYTSWRDLIADPKVDMIDICVPTPAHRELSMAGLEAGKHVLCEKPMSVSVAECDEMLAVAAKSKAKFMIAQVIRFWPEFVYLQQVYKSREFGALRALHIRRHGATPDYSLGNWLLNPELSGGAILDLHVHDVDFVLGLLGKPKKIYARGYANERGSVDRVHAAWDYGNNTSICLEGAWDMPTGFGFNMGFSAVFEKAALNYDLDSGQPMQLLRPGQEPTKPALQAEDGYFAEIEYFLQCIERNEQPKVSTPQESRDAVALALLEKESVLSGAPVAVS